MCAQPPGVRSNTNRTRKKTAPHSQKLFGIISRPEIAPRRCTPFVPFLENGTRTTSNTVLGGTFYVMGSGNCVSIPSVWLLDSSASLVFSPGFMCGSIVVKREAKKLVLSLPSWKAILWDVRKVPCAFCPQPRRFPQEWNASRYARLIISPRYRELETQHKFLRYGTK